MQPARTARPDEITTQVTYRLFEALHEAEQRARRRLEALVEVVFELDEDGRITFLNRAWTTLLGHPVAESLGATLADFCADADADNALLTPGGATGGGVVRFDRTDGEPRFLQVSFGSEEEDGAVTGSLVDVTDRLQAMADAENERLFLSTVLDNLTEGVFACDAEGRLLLSNRGSAHASVGVREWLRRYDLFHADGRTPFTPEELPLGRALRGEQVTDLPMVAGRPGRTQHHLRVTARQMVDGAGTVLGAVAVATDVTEQHEAEARLAHIARHDGLTGLATRSAFLDVLAAAQGRHSAVLVVDVDDFGSLNERFGQQAGDVVLREIAARLVRLVPSQDDVARLAADAFALLVDAADETAAAAAAAQVADALSLPLEVAGQQVVLSASVGAAVRDVADEPASLLAAAEAAQQRASRHGHGSYVLFAPHMRAEGRARVEYEAALHRATEERQFTLVYQPKVALEDHRLTGVEALIRWNHPERGVVSPAEFISVAEQTGLIVPIGCWVLEESFRQAAQWHEQYPDQAPLEMSVNVSARQFDHELADTVRTALETYGNDPATIWLEVTESMVMADVDAAIVVLRSLKALGVNITVDDFGTGYSSLAYLRRLPLDGLKIDRSFVDRIESDPGDAAIVAAIIALAHALELLVVAEGIETAEQLRRLRNLGCESGQGYYYARPQPPEFLDHLLHAAEQRGVAHGTLQPATEGATRRADAVLVVDDAADMRQLARISLATGGFEVHEARNGSEALGIARRLLPDCVVLDVHMPGLSGFEVCRALRADPATAGCTIVMLTGTGDAADKVEAYSCGADDYIVKPFAPRDLLGRTRDALRRRRESAT